MSGHSKWSQIKRQKAVADQRRSGLFTKFANAITIAAKQGGSDPGMNFKLRVEIDKAKAGNMPNDNIERAIARASGGGDGAAIEEATYEAYGPGGVAIIIEAATDNKNRTAGSIKSILAKHSANLGSPGSVLWMFDKKGVIRIARERIADTETFELAAIDAGAEDISTSEDGTTITTSAEAVSTVAQQLQSAGYTLESSEVELVPQNIVAITPQQQQTLQHILDALEDDEDVTNYYTNAAEG